MENRQKRKWIQQKVPPTLALAGIGGTSYFYIFLSAVYPKLWDSLRIEFLKTAEGLQSFYLLLSGYLGAF
ncbi:hypothetical protein NXX35_20090 [Bacteroides xylanisolvens]|nr:hypothetical protein NXX35_20090 [Bacteroides xylanisolvens]